MLFDIVVAALIMVCGVAVYFALLGLIVLYNKVSAGNAFALPQESNIKTAELEEVEPDELEGVKEKIPLERLLQPLKVIKFNKFVKSIKNIRLPKTVYHKKEKTGIKDPLLLEHKKREEEFRLKMQQRNEEFLQELKQRREESRLAQEQDATAESQKDISPADENTSDKTNNLDNTGS
jgi:hypothetical protein